MGSGIFAGQRAQKAHLLQGSGGIAAEVADLRQDIADEFAANAALAVEEWTNPATADVDGIKVAIATVAAATVYSGAALDGVVGGGAISPPRNITVTTAGGTAADAPATATIAGKDIYGKDLSEVITVAQTATIAVGAKAFAKVTSITLPAADGTDATLAFGFGALIGLAKPLKSRAGALAVLSEITGGALLSLPTGTFATQAVGAPNGTYSPAAAPDGSRDYALYYEYDASLNT
jgi:hypothetical protein